MKNNDETFKSGIYNGISVINHEKTGFINSGSRINFVFHILLLNPLWFTQISVQVDLLFYKSS